VCAPDDAALRPGIAALLRRLREQRELSIAAAAGLADVQPNTISRLERGASDVGLDTLHRYLGGLGFALEVVVTEVETGKERGRLRLKPWSEGEDEG